MSYQANVYQVIIASPGDVPRERQLAREIVYEWNSINSLDKKICLLPVGWEHNSSPEMGGRAQEFINKQVLENSDLLIGIFWTRIGSPTGQTNGKRLNSDFEPRTRATWQAVIENLVRNDILEERGYKGEVFALTLYGYKIADNLKEK